MNGISAHSASRHRAIPRNNRVITNINTNSDDLNIENTYSKVAEAIDFIPDRSGQPSSASSGFGIRDKRQLHFASLNALSLNAYKHTLGN